eukprot:gb/GEZJ01007001.1/.p1 GENE.gb/GEZJ01007001.1/~~gb/GEZJ01007001.1/.p1  ORF type:complete len:102 (-),score=5.99 gb/GEZJ01007001.1/:73-378(-)
MLRTSILQSSYSWDYVLLVLEFKVNTHLHASTSLSLFEMAFGYNPKTSFTRPLEHCRTNSEAAIHYISRSNSMAAIAWNYIASAADNYKFSADQHRREVVF